MIPDRYPPLRQWIETLRGEMELCKTTIDVLEGRLRLCEALLMEVLKEKEGEDEH